MKCHLPVALAALWLGVLPGCYNDAPLDMEAVNLRLVPFGGESMLISVNEMDRGGFARFPSLEGGRLTVNGIETELSRGGCAGWTTAPDSPVGAAPACNNPRATVTPDAMDLTGEVAIEVEDARGEGVRLVVHDPMSARTLSLQTPQTVRPGDEVVMTWSSPTDVLFDPDVNLNVRREIVFQSTAEIEAPEDFDSFTVPASVDGTTLRVTVPAGAAPGEYQAFPPEFGLGISKCTAALCYAATYAIGVETFTLIVE